MSDTTLYPTVPGMAPGIIRVSPLQLQCHDCRAIYEGDGIRNIGYEIQRSHYRFHICEHGGGRRCPHCLVAAIAACPNTRCKE